MSLEINEDRSYPILSDQRLTEMIKQELNIENLQAKFAGNVGALDSAQQRELDLAVKFAGSLIAKYPTELGGYSIEDLLIKIKSVAQAEADLPAAFATYESVLASLRAQGFNITEFGNPDGTVFAIVHPPDATVQAAIGAAMAAYNPIVLAANFFNFTSSTEQTLVKAFEDVNLP